VINSSPCDRAPSLCNRAGTRADAVRIPISPLLLTTVRRACRDAALILAAGREPKMSLAG